ncbi:hypothetical protein KMW28_02705 [Flammeovirga yaeyamensis]|uniref:Uncharacterized protein n=1 Tax=Flammeovirga yaeyamensis TaxID=367791 RepID=A0AAX1N7U8_9BACT|nr:hypothetical protein [Flammeovirga yaeyamensis]MBB3700422.1 hypothetical protein [Flammeovirga yaeyamensis]NMF36953.1 hypothetical protein [Flammeovirga yaeyamensis]QWG02501.1 hypothetical protein KMW28_02705 [Flammeovirga yaeyamensis]
MNCLKTTIIVPIIDSLPEYLSLFLDQLSHQKHVDALLLCNFNINIETPNNTKLIFAEINNLQDLVQYLGSQKADYLLQYDYWTIGSIQHLYGQVYLFLNQLKNENTEMIILNENNENLIFFKSNEKVIEEVLINQNTKSLNKVEADIINNNFRKTFYFNQGQIIDYYNRMSYPFINIEQLLKHRIVKNYDSDWRKIPSIFYLDTTGFYSESEFRQYSQVRFQKEVKAFGVKCKEYFLGLFQSNNKEIA